ncbi:uncharacterized protein LOC131948764 [Physella acuta]|uniref:uncharacterized protein LOC131948764 n=1 Tax=Physella acuta TaxID=109671 RepID=UPI0027DB3AF1|nr:uncharacterized protein LOC131948764 [Physella acuta]
MAYPHAKPYSPKKYSVDLDDNNVPCTRCMPWPPVLLTVLQARRARRPHVMAPSRAPLNLLPRLVLDEASNAEGRRRLDNHHAAGAELGNNSNTGTVRSSSLQASSSAPQPSTSAPSTSTSAPRPSTSAPRPSTSAPRPSTSAPRPSTSASNPSTSAPKPSTSAPKVSTTAPKTSTPAPQPSTSAPQPSTLASNPSTPSPQPSTSAPRPSTSAPRPSTSASNSSTPAPKPNTPAPKPSTPAPKPSTPAPNPSTPAPKPSNPASQPSTPASQPSTSVSKACTTASKLSTPASQPSTPASQPSTSVSKACTTASKLSTPASQPSTPSPQPSTSAPRPSTSAPRPSTSASNSSTPAPKPNTPAPKPSTPAPKPSTPAPNPSTPAPKPSNPASQPSTPASQPSTSVSKACTPASKLSTPASQPSTPASQPSTSVSKASTPAPKPSTLAPKPSTSAPKPSTPIPKPSTPAPKPSTPAPKPSTPAPKASTSGHQPSTPLLPTTMTENGTHISDTKTKTTDMNTNSTPKPLQTIFDSKSRHVFSSTNSRHSLESTSSSDSSTSTSCSQKSLSIFSQEPTSRLDLSGPSHAGPRKRKLPSPVNENSDPKRLVLGIVKPEDVKPGPVYDPNRTPTWAKDYMIRSMQYKSGFIDTHCDVEMMVEAIRKHPTFCLMKETVPFNFAGVVAAISNPAMFSKTDGLDGFVKLTLQTDEIWMTFGCHPRHAGSFTATHITTLKMALSIDRCVGVGPCGLNYTLKPSIDQQKFVFKSQLQLAVELNLPIVIHCKHAEDDCFLMMRKFVPRDHRIHVQGFIGSKEIAKQWMEYFSNMYFGITPVIAIKSMPQSIRDMVKSLPTRRMILEAGAPNIIPDSHKPHISVSHHGFALFTAKAIAVEKGYSTDDLFLATRQNTKDLYGI